MSEREHKVLEKIVVLTANRPRHLYFAQEIYDSLGDVLGFFLEDKTKHESHMRGLCGKSGFIEEHNKDFLKTEKEFFAAQFNPDKNKLFYCGDVNEEYEKIRDLNPDILAVFGTSLIKEPLINASRHIINLHLGISPHYRGNYANLFAIYNKQMDYVGATIHFLDRKIDAGRIIRIAKPEIDRHKDTMSIVMCKAIREGIAEMINAIKILQLNGRIKSYRQDLRKGRTGVFLRV